MKRFYLAALVLLTAASVFGVATVTKVAQRNVGTKTTTVQYTASTWTVCDSIRSIQAGDSSSTVYAATGEVELLPGQKLYCGWSHTLATKSLPDWDTCIFEPMPRFPNARKVRIPFECRYTRSDTTAALASDTAYFCIAQNITGLTATVYNLTLTATTGLPTINDAF